LATPFLLGREAVILEQIEAMELPVNEFNIINIHDNDNVKKYAKTYANARERKGITMKRALRHIGDNANYQAAAMVLHGDADTMISGEEQHYPNALKPVLKVLSHTQEDRTLAGVYIVIPKNGKPYFFSDCTVNVNPDSETLAKIAGLTADLAISLGIDPKVAFLSFSNFGSANYPESDKVAKAARIINEIRPELVADGEMQATTALDEGFLKETFPFSRLQENANILVFPTLDASNIAYKLMDELGEAKVIGPILLGMNHPVQILHRNVDVDTIFHMAVFAVLQAEERRKNKNTQGGKK